MSANNLGRIMKAVRYDVRNLVYPFLHPRYLLHGERHILPKPPWFVTNRQGTAIARQLFYFTADQKAWRLPGLFWHALRG